MTLRRWLPGLVVLTACGDAVPPAPPAAPGMMLPCPGDREAAVPDGAGGIRCLAVGARGYGGAALWTAVANPTTARYVRAGAAAGGDGTRERPFRTLSEALDGVKPGGTVVIAAGRVTLDVSARVAAAVDVVGAGPDRTTIVLPAGDTGLGWEAAGGSLRGVTLLRAGAPRADDAVVAIDVRDGGRLAIEDVVIRGAGIALQVGDATLRADRVDVLSSGRNGVRLLRGARGSLASFVVRGGAGTGVGADGAHLHLRDGLIDHNTAHGLSLVRAPTTRGGSVSCDGPIDLDGEGPRDCLSQVSIQCNGIAGLYLDGARVVEARGIAVWGTRAPPGAPGGDGVYVQNGARLMLDLDRPMDGAAGAGSLIGSNARMGVLVDGAGTAVAARGLRAQRNANGGMFVQEAAVVEEVVGGDFQANGGVGIGVARGAELRSLRGSSIAETHAAEVAAVGAAGPVTLMLADGLSVAGGAVGASGNRFDRNERFGAVFFMASGELTANRGDGNRYGIQAWSSTLRGVDGNEVRGREAAPRDVQPVASGLTR